MGVWIETSVLDNWVHGGESHPAWVCGLKLFGINHRSTSLWSHPAWVCGLKPIQHRYSMIHTQSHPAWVCGLKLRRSTDSITSKRRSHPAWVCGLKLISKEWKSIDCLVTPCVGVWIETCLCLIWGILQESHPAWVCGLKQSINYIASAIKESHPAWVCGLKHLIHGIDDGTGCHTLRGCVDWNTHPGYTFSFYLGHTLRGCVDWNRWVASTAWGGWVTPCVGVWIETINIVTL